MAAYSNANNLGAAIEVYPLKDIIGFGGMYTTLSVIKEDKDGNKTETIISTNDDLVKVPENPEEVKAGDPVNVRFRIADIIPNDGDEGVQENRVYAMSLPEELIPAAESADGEQLVNPAEPLKFFGDEDGIQAYGGIYNVGGEYQLRMIFKNVEDWIDISGYFQYGANVSTTVIPGETYELEYVPGGTIQFTVAKDSPSVRYGDYTLSMGGDSGGPTTYYWQVNIIKEEKNDDASKTSSESEAEPDPLIFPFRELTIDSDDAMGVWVNEENQGIFDAYGDGTGPGCSLGITYETEDEDGKNKNDFITANAGSVIENEKGKTVIRFSADDIQADLEFRKDDAVADTIVQNNHDQFAYITNKIYVHISDGNGGNAKNIKSLTLYVPTLTYDDYCQTGDVYYAGKAVLSVKAEEGENTGETDETAEEIAEGSEEKKEASGSVKAYYNDLTAPSVSGGSRNPSNSYEFLPEDIYTHLGSGDTYYRGNYYWMEFDPAVENNSGVNYYLGNWSFLPGNYFWTSYDSSNYATFGTSGSGLYGMPTISGFEYLRKVSVAQIKQDPNLVAHILTSEIGAYEEPQMDVKLQYQLKKVFARVSEDNDVIIYRSTKPHQYGEYSYLVIDPQTVKTAQQNNNKGWREYIDGTYNYSNGGYSTKAASFKIHIFNAPCTTLQLEAVQKIGSVISDDNNYTNSYFNGTYVTAIDERTLPEADRKDGTIVHLRNNFNVSAADGNGKGISAPGRVTIKTPFVKTGDATEAGMTADGNPILTWSVNVNLTSLYTVEKLKSLAKVTLTDDLNPALKLIDTSVEMKNIAGTAIDSSLYEWQMIGNRFVVTLKNPADHPNIILTFKTECQANLNTLTNQAELVVEGEGPTTTKSNELTDLVALSQHGQIVAMKNPDVAIEAWKYVDHKICTEAGKYRFELTLVDADGNPLTGKDAYSEVMTNNADGKISFSKIHYKGIHADVATYYYQIRELPDAMDDVVLDDRVFTVKVDIQKSGNLYLAATTVVSPENYSRVEFDNTTKPKLTDFTVTKVWDDNDNAAGLRPDTIIVHLYQDGQPYNNMMVTLNESNNWTYTWTGLPAAGGEYSVVEDPVEGYEGSAVTTGNEMVLTNKIVDQPDQPDNPNKPDQPTTPDQPNTPDTPATPDHPTNPGNPGRPHHYRDTDNSGDNPPSPTTSTDAGENPDNSTATDNHSPSPLPKTGQLWWPVLILLILGAAMLGRGIYVERKNKGKHEE